MLRLYAKIYDKLAPRLDRRRCNSQTVGTMSSYWGAVLSPLLPILSSTTRLYPKPSTSCSHCRAHRFQDTTTVRKSDSIPLGTWLDFFAQQLIYERKLTRRDVRRPKNQVAALLSQPRRSPLLQTGDMHSARVNYNATLPLSHRQMVWLEDLHPATSIGRKSQFPQ